MWKVILIMGLVAVPFAIAASIGTYDAGVIVEGCLSEYEMWGSVDGTKFYFCLGDNMAMEQSCPPNEFFVKNATVTGCIPDNLVTSECVFQGEPEPCEGEFLFQPQPSSSPTEYYFCTNEGEAPVIVPCPENRAFLKQDGYMGCFEWAEWREITGCNI